MTGLIAPPGISYTAITNRLKTLYQGVTVNNHLSFQIATPELVAQIATLESFYEQFANETNYSVKGFWPNESLQETNKNHVITSHKGAHIGLMQIPVTGGMADAWDWLQNTMDGVLLPVNVKSNYSFQYKLDVAYKLFASPTIIAAHPGLLALSPCQLEEMALDLNGPSNTGKSSGQYYVPLKSNGSWQWAINPNTSSAAIICGVCYVISVRGNTPLNLASGSSPSSCSATDPPTNLDDECENEGCPITVNN